MLVVHWAKHNKTNGILANGLRPASRTCRDGHRTNKGVYAYPYSRNKHFVSTWRKNLKSWDKSFGNYNGFVFRLEPEDFPVLAGDWAWIRFQTPAHVIESLDELSRRYAHLFCWETKQTNDSDVWPDCFEIIIPRQIAPRRILKVLKDREPRGAADGRMRRESDTEHDEV